MRQHRFRFMRSRTFTAASPAAAAAPHRNRAAGCFFAALTGLLLLLSPLSAQTVRWQPGAGQLGFNQVSQLALVFEDCEPEGPVELPQVDGLIFGRPSQSTNRSISFGSGGRQSTSTFTLTYPVRPERRSPVTIPAFSVRTDKGPMRVTAANFTIGEATVGNSGLSMADISTVTLSTPKRTVWAGEVFPVTYTLSVLARYWHSPASQVQWQPAPLVAEDWSKIEAGEATVRGERRLIATQSTRAYAKEPGVVTLKPAQQVVNLQVGTQGFGLFTTPAVEQRVLTTEPVDLTVRPLPPAPTAFSGAVGQFTLVSKVVPTTPTVGEPVTWTLELAGTGNWPDFAGLPEREVSADFSVVQPKSKRTMKDNSLFEGTLTEDVVLVPNRAGRYTLGPIKFTYFDTASGAYRTLSTESVTLAVAAGATSPSTTPAASGPVQFTLPGAAGTAMPAPTREAVAPVPPEHLPRDPVPGPQRGLAPLETRTLVWVCAGLAVGVPLVGWLVLAALRSRAFDPERRRRAAATALAQTLATIRASSAQPREVVRLLRDWQQHTAALWDVRHAAPGARRLHAAVAARARDAAAPWTRLWEEADRAQHGRNVGLPNDWLARAEAALKAVRIPAWKPTSLFETQHLFPLTGRRPTPPPPPLAPGSPAPRTAAAAAAAAMVLLAGLFVVADARGAQSPLELYRNGKHAAAEKAWRADVKAEPSDWAARHNLGLALAQQDRWAEATAHWTSAFLLQPRNEATRWDLTLGLQRAGLAPPELVAFARAEGRHAIARLASPGEWQLALALAALLLGTGIVLLLLRGYGYGGVWARATAIVLVIVAIFAAGTATLSLHTYGQLAHPQVTLVWRASTLRSLPTEADVQKVSSLSAGSIAIVDQTFLGWSRLQFAGGQSGWARNEDLAPLYR